MYIYSFTLVIYLVLLTTVKQRSYYGKSTDITKEAGIVIIRLSKLIIILTYAKPHHSSQMINNCEALADELTNLEL